ncbi:PDR/VanB family oxidoreductase [Corynebacterium heidelbergense]|uniref:Oxidoreductase n=1 Tax=Corynebacterium heidelbergense TaxID=2055947 RepID=A0A364V3U7_9CORY|nr:PDR/VanB family oxidoreductase [Corynebacterium heidelbergense]RAV31298.1 hypothetical protein DLJ54_09125 [Corynebacterium heidelbergense]
MSDTTATPGRAGTNTAAVEQPLLDVLVHSITRASDRILLIELRPLEPATLPTAGPGAHIDVHIGPLVRQYSLVEAPGIAGSAKQRYVIGVLREKISRGGSKAIHEQLRVGHRLQISGPRNHFELVEAPRHVLLAGGVGVTPLAAMARHLGDAEFSLDVYAAQPSDFPLFEYLQSALGDADATPADHSGRLHWHASGSGDSLRTAEHLPQPYTPGAQLYLCGPPGFLDTAKALAAADGWPEESVHVEHFVLEEPLDLSGASFEVVAASTGQRLPVGEEQTIAEVLLAAGYPVELSCEQGMCGSCILGVKAGIPEHRDVVQTEAEHASNQLINVCCSRSRTPSLTVDV